MTSKTPELLPCHWCGGSAAYQADTEIGFTTIHGMGTVKCNECGRSDGFVYRTKDAAITSWNTRATPTNHDDHSDDFAVSRFAKAMREKLARAREKGRSGWDDPSKCSDDYLADLLVHHLTKGNPGTFEDVANFAMMLHQRDAQPSTLANAARRNFTNHDDYDEAAQEVGLL